MNKKIILLPLIALAITGCGTQNNNPGHSKHEHTFDSLVVINDADWRTYLLYSDFNTQGLKVGVKCSTCNQIEEVDYIVENNTQLVIDQQFVTIKYENLYLEYGIKVTEKLSIACVGDSLTAGHYWANESYPTKLSNIVNENYEVGNFGVNGISITGYGGSWNDPEMRYIKQDVYQNSVNFAPDIFAIMLGTNDATGWANAEATFDEYYHILLDSYLEQFPYAKYIMMVSPPVIQNTFGIPNDTIRDEINPRQRDLADEYGFELLDLREEFEATDDYINKFLRPNDGVHFTALAAEYVAGRVWDIIKD